MKSLTGAFAAGAALLCVAGCSQNTGPKPLPTPPAVVDFSADTTKINPGESATLTFSVTDATDVTIVTQTGEKVPYDGDAAHGTLTVTPLTTTFYVLRALGPGGRANAFVQIAVGEDLREVFFVAVPPVIDSGDHAQLLWSAFHAKSAELRSSLGEVTPVDVSQGSGVLDVTPARTTGYSFVATGANDETVLEAHADLQVRPVLAAFTASPSAAKVGETITLAWTTRGAQEVVVSEKTFGPLFKATVPADETAADQGTFTWTVPDQRPDQQAVVDGFPLQFTLTVKQSEPAVTLTKSISGFVGEGPHIVAFVTPVAVTTGHTFELSWKTQNAERLQVLANGGLIYEPLPRETGKVADGRITLKAPQADTPFTLIAFGHEGTRVESTATVKVVALPEITDFDLPLSVNAAGDAASATWTTANATRVNLLVKNGPTVYTTSDTAKVASGGQDVYPGNRTTFVLQAFNDAGDSVTAEQTVDVSSAAGTITATPAPITPGETVTVTWALDAAVSPNVIGDPTYPAIANNPATDWYELDGHVDAQEIVFDDPDNASVSLPVAQGFRFPFVGEMESAFFVSTNGFVSFDNADPMPDNVTLDDPSDQAPTMVAPFWDDLVLGEDGRVLYLWEGTAFPRRLIVQWDKVHLAADPEGTQLTFEAQLWETGELRFAYKVLNGSQTAGEGATIGWKLNDSRYEKRGDANTAVLTANDELIFMAAGSATGTYEVKPDRTSDFVLFARRPASNAYVVYSAYANVIAPGSVLVNEAMVVPDSSATAGRWVELYNSATEPQDVAGVKLESAATSSSFTLPPDTVIAPGGYLVIGDSADPLQNGGANVTLEWTGFTPSDSADDTISITAVNAIATLDYLSADLTPGKSLQEPDRAIDTGGVTLPCDRTQTFGTNGAIGTPGAANETCFEYRLSSIPEAFEDISATGTPVFLESTDDGTANVSFGDSPVTYFGTPVPEVSVCSNGWIAFVPTEEDDYSNATAPSTSEPTAVAAVFWDDLKVLGTPDNNVFVQRLSAAPGIPARWIIQWHNATHLGAGDTLEMQAKFFDNGVIEYHYSTMTSGSSSNYANGNSATVWLQRLTGDAALPIGINTAVIAPHTAYRFTPTP